LKTASYKIVYLITGLGSGGAEMMLYRLLENLDRNSFQPVVVTLLENEGAVKSKIESLGVVVYSVNIKSKFDWGAFFRLQGLLKELKPDILHTQLYAADITGRITGRLLKVPVIMSSIRNIYYGGSLRNLFLKITERFAHKTTFVSRAAAERFKDLGIVPEYKAQVIYNGLDPEQFYAGLSLEEKKDKRIELGLPAAGFLFLAVGSLSKQKGYFDLIKALSGINNEHEQWSLVIAGKGPLEEELIKEAVSSGLQEKVIFLGNHDDVPALMAASDALVLSSLWEGLPGVVLEAMASELPVVATAVGGTPELVIENETGFLVPAGEPEELVEALQKMMRLDDEKRRAMGRAGRKRVEEVFHVEKMVKAYEALYFTCLREKNLL